jgi:hypothetical protein
LRSVSGFHLAPCLAIIFRSFLWPYARAFAPRTPLNKTFSRAANALIVLGNAPRNAFVYGVISLIAGKFLGPVSITFRVAAPDRGPFTVILEQ